MVRAAVIAGRLGTLMVTRWPCGWPNSLKAALLPRAAHTHIPTHHLAHTTLFTHAARKERQAKAAAFAMANELNSEMTEEEAERMQRSGMGIGGGLDKGEATLFEKKLSKEEKKALSEQKKAEREEKKEAEKALQAKIARNRAGESGEAPPEEEEGERSASPAVAKKLTAKEKKAAKEAAKNAGVEGEFGELNLDDGGAFKHAICTAVLLSRKDSRDIKIGSFSISLFGQLIFDDQILELTYGHRYGLIAQVPTTPPTSLHISTPPDRLSTDLPI